MEVNGIRKDFFILPIWKPAYKSRFFGWCIRSCQILTSEYHRKNT